MPLTKAETTRTPPENSTPATPGGHLYLPPSDDSFSSEETSFDSTPARTKPAPKSKTTDPLNDYLRTQGISSDHSLDTAKVVILCFVHCVKSIVELVCG